MYAKSKIMGLLVTVQMFITPKSASEILKIIIIN